MAFIPLHQSHSPFSHALLAVVHGTRDAFLGLAEGFVALHRVAEERDRLNAKSDRALSEMGLTRDEIPVAAMRRAMALGDVGETKV